MAGQSPWVVRRGALWSAQPRGSSLRPVTAHLPVRFAEIQGRAAEALLDSTAQIDPIAPEAILRRFDEGRRCFAGWVNGRVAAYGWVTYGPEWVGEFERALRVEPGEAYIWDCATLPEYRRQGLYSALLSAIADQLCLEGIERAWIIGVLSSPVMLRAFAKAGFQPIACLSYARLFKARTLLLVGYPGVTRAEMAGARRLLAAERERTVGPLIAGYSPPVGLPVTHYSRP